MIRPGIRLLPWGLALAGLAILLVVSGFVVWPLVLIWLCVLAGCWVVGRMYPWTRRTRIVVGLALLPLLFLLVFEGGWWLIPADLAWLAIEIADHGPGAANASQAGPAA